MRTLIAIDEKSRQCIAEISYTFAWNDTMDVILADLEWLKWPKGEVDYADISRFVRLFREGKTFGARRFARSDGNLLPTGDRVDGLTEDQLTVYLDNIALGDQHHSSAISFAQFNEDLVLDRIIGHVENGFYIDVGAMDPHHESVTKLFYQRGWQGINVEPRPNAFAHFISDRSRDINLNVAISTKAADITIYEVQEHPGLSTSDENLVAEYAQKGMRANPIKVCTRTLTDICDEFSAEHIHFLKIDVEGAEKDVLASMDFKKHRPWVLAIESTIPCTDIPSHGDWEQFVISSGYSLLLSHNINRFYIADERRSFLAKEIIFDDIESSLK